MILSNLSDRERKILYICVVVAILCASYNYIFKPFSGKWLKLGNDIADEEIKFLRFKRLLELKEGIEEEYNRYHEKIKPRGSEEEEIAALLKEIEMQARERGAYISKIKPLPAEEKAFCKEYTVQLKIQADMLKLAEFLYNLQLSSQILKVKRLEIRTTREKEKGLRSDILITRIVSLGESINETD